MNDLCLWSLVIAVCCLGAPVLVIVVASARIAGDESERERERERLSEIRPGAQDFQKIAEKGGLDVLDAHQTRSVGEK